MDKIFKSGSGVSYTYDKMIARIAEYIKNDPNGTYEITIGTDSQNHSMTKMVEVIAIHNIGNGGIFFSYSEYIRKITSLKEKITEETARSLENAQGFIDALGVALIDYDIDIEDLNIHFGIHCDIGHYGKTSNLISEITNWVTAMGYECTIKPDSYAASGIANKITK